MNRRIPKWCLFLLASSLGWFLFSTALLIGIENTPHDTKDSAGREMGFNNHLSREHFAIMLRNFNAGDLFTRERILDHGFLLTHLAGIFLVATERKRILKWFLGVQVIWFPIAFFGGMVFVLDLEAVVRGGMDREAFTDIPIWNILVSLPWWVCASFLVWSRHVDVPKLQVVPK